jgi:hypothetical protein
MDAENALRDNSSDGQAVEAVAEHTPDLDGVPALAFIVEAVESVDVGALMVTTQQVELVGEFDFVGEEKTNSLNTLAATVNVVAEEEVRISLGGLPPQLE